MPKEILINVEPQEKRVAIVRDGRLEEFYIEHPHDKTIVGNIYKGRIDNVLPSIGAAFVDIGLPKKGFLYLSQIDSAFENENEGLCFASKPQMRKGQEILVQVVKESFGNKGPRLSTQIGIAGRYLVLMPLAGQIGVSRRIEDEQERLRLRKIIDELHLPGQMGVIVRTAAEAKSKRELLHDSRFLIKLWKRLKAHIQRTPAPALIYEEYDLALRIIRDSFTDEVNRLIVDSQQEYLRIVRFMRSFMSNLVRRVELYKGEALFEEKDVERQISKIFESKVYLKSGAYLVIEPTEGLVVIDVNSGSFKHSSNQEEMALKVNCEAAEEIAHQLILRDLGGIIVIDFIDMESEAHRRQVLGVLKQALKRDKAHYDILGISKFGLVEMTRERVHRTAQMLSYQSCPYCLGRGKIKSVITVSASALRQLRQTLHATRPRQVELSVNPQVADEINKQANLLHSLQRRYRTKIMVLANPTYHIEEIKIVPT